MLCTRTHSSTRARTRGEIATHLFRTHFVHKIFFWSNFLLTLALLPSGRKKKGREMQQEYFGRREKSDCGVFLKDVLNTQEFLQRRPGSLTSSALFPSLPGDAPTNWEEAAQSSVLAAWNAVEPVNSAQVRELHSSRLATLCALEWSQRQNVVFIVR